MEQGCGVDISHEFPKPRTDEVVRAADVVITMGCGDACPIFQGKRYEDWVLDDPADLDLDGVRRVRDEIERRVHQILDQLGVGAHSSLCPPASPSRGWTVRARPGDGARRAHPSPVPVSSRPFPQA
ncbi:hypothetical protein [Cellulomonas sp. 73-145]|uniref:arsenate reductase/protein-tyrosine-phosphatase family protein n=1 Tax=Cellulomonas sp. 73-145 TaxID=1895739 RepID=UPI001AD259C6|nr:hypothetical protein [Cellulomonas sp.]